VFTSREPKAEETGRLIAARLGIPWAPGSGLHEHDRAGEVFYQDRDVFIRRVRDFFAHPEALVFGRETADQAHQRFATAVQMLAAGHPEETLVFVTHGTVMSLFVSRAVGLAPFPFWQSLGMPAYVVLRAASPDRFEILAQETWETSWDAEVR
jgi:broad specificity phosphatase PhoE